MSVQHSKTIKQKKTSQLQCAYCKRVFGAVQYPDGKFLILHRTIDHFYPLSKGGSNLDVNKVICCDQCNTIKADLLPKEFLNKIQECIARKVHYKFHSISYPVDLLTVLSKSIIKLAKKLNDACDSQTAIVKVKRTERVLGEIPVFPDSVIPFKVDPLSIKMKEKRLLDMAKQDALEGYIFTTASKHENFHL